MRKDILKCRAKCTQTEEWVYGIAGYDEEGYMVLRNIKIVEKPDNPFNGATIISTYPINENTIDRCTHLVDKNGQEIYENDIVLIDGTNVRGRVWYSNTSGRWHVVCLKGKSWLSTMKEIKRINKYHYKAHKHGGSLPLYHVVQQGAIIIGNRRDNPELLKPTEE